MITTAANFTVRLARDEADLRAAQRLRYDVFVDELGGDGALVDHDQRLEIDRLDHAYDHLLLIDEARNDDVIGVYRLLPPENVSIAGEYYTEGEFDLSLLKQSGRRILELGRACLHADYRGGAAMFYFWQGLASYVLERNIEILFGLASFHGTDVEALSSSLTLLEHRYLAPPELRVRSVNYQSMQLLPVEDVDRVAAMRDVPALIKAYLRLGGFVGDGAFVDHAFNTTDVCLVMDTAKMSASAKATYSASSK